MRAAMGIVWALSCAGITLPVRAEVNGRDVNGPEVVARCRKAYDALSSYQGASIVHAVHSYKNGRRETYDLRVAIQFARPGKIAVQGKAGKAFFFYRSDGTSTWTRDDRATSWHKPESDDMVFAEMGTQVLALLLHWKFDVFEGKTTAFKEKVVVEKIGGQPAYRVETLGGDIRSVYWIDPKSFLLRKVYSHTPFKTADFTDGGEVDTEVTFVGTKVNPPLAVRLFAKPPGVP